MELIIKKNAQIAQVYVSRVGLKRTWFVLILVSSVMWNKLGLASAVCFKFDSATCFN